MKKKQVDKHGNFVTLQGLVCIYQVDTFYQQMPKTNHYPHQKIILTIKPTKKTIPNPKKTLILALKRRKVKDKRRHVSLIDGN